MKDEVSRNADLLRRTKLFALRIIKAASSLPKNPVASALAVQLVKAGTSPGANYREAHRSRSRAEFSAKVGDCLKEQDETLYWLELLSESGLVRATRLQPLIDECNELVAIFTTIHKKART
jgi:four helix bundle protein